MAVLLSAGCVTSAPPADPASAPPPSAGAPSASTPSGLDLLYLSMTLAHVEQTLEIVALVRGRVADPQLRTLVAAVEVTEADERDTVRGWLREAGRDGRDDHDHSGHVTAADDLARLRTAADGEVDAVLAGVLSEHQRAAADLARAHLTAGSDPRVLDLAGRIERSRTAQVAMLAGLPSPEP
ncbi:Uncharacterized conserved protein, DUF305 family [Micromonospora nigra]|uniref:Uncharacterized conserved protein, DUF305 family n=1 Tax=Micromonospora nigra TaxID=145857 RepID=A0A1C6SP29_9ACTN|nr:Uncharacterized conserved protein, DUF305 family [Micromonospora nigra]